MFENVSKSPLNWPAGWKRSRYTSSSRYDTGNSAWTIHGATQELEEELRKLGVHSSSIILSSNLLLNMDGSPRGNQVQPSDKGVACYFKMNDKATVIACDKWDKVQHNIRAIAMAVSCMRALERCGASEIMERAFTGFTALPDTREAWHQVFQCSAHLPTDSVRVLYRGLVVLHHPDKGGTQQGFIRIQNAWEQFQKERGLL